MLTYDIEMECGHDKHDLFFNLDGDDEFTLQNDKLPDRLIEAFSAVTSSDIDVVPECLACEDETGIRVIYSDGTVDSNWQNVNRLIDRIKAGEVSAV